MREVVLFHPRDGWDLEYPDRVPCPDVPVNVVEMNVNVLFLFLTSICFYNNDFVA